MAEIKSERLKEEELKNKGVFSWPIWEKEASTFDWSYSDNEQCYILEGKARVEPSDGRQATEFGSGDFVTFPKGLDCVWKISEKIKKHYNFG